MTTLDDFALISTLIKEIIMKNLILSVICFASLFPSLSFAKISCSVFKADLRQSSNRKTIKMAIIENFETAQTFQTSFEGTVYRVVASKPSNNLFASIILSKAPHQSVHVRGTFDKSGTFEFFQTQGGKNEYRPDITLGIACKDESLNNRNN
jgi:hypothetical protein